MKNIIILVLCCTLCLGTAISAILVAFKIYPNLIGIYIGSFMYILYKIFWKGANDIIDDNIS